MSWYIKNIRDVQWWDAGRFGVYGDFEQGEHFPEFGFNFGVAWPGQPAAMYHREEHQEGFLVLSGEILLIVEGEERLLKAWDYFHCPAGVEHETSDPKEAYGPFPEPQKIPFREEFLPPFAD